MASKPICGVYAIIHVESGKTYFGQAADINKRWSVHYCKLMAGNHHSKHLQRCWNKYGAKAFVWVILEECSRSLLNKREQSRIDSYPSHLLLNCHPRAESARGYKHRASSKRKMSKAAKRIASDPAERKRRSERAKAQHASGVLGAHTVSQEARKRMSRSMRKFALNDPRAKAGREKAWKSLTSEEASRRSYLRKIFQ